MADDDVSSGVFQHLVDAPMAERRGPLTTPPTLAATCALGCMLAWGEMSMSPQVTNFFTDYSRGTGRVAKTHIDMTGFTDLLQGILLTRLLGISLSVMQNHLYKHGSIRFKVTL
jgi:hypothetical protein